MAVTAGPFMGVVKNELLKAFIKNEAPGFSPKWVGAFTRAAAKAVTSESAKVLKGATLANEELVVFITKNGGEGLVTGRVYWVVGATGEKFELSQTKGGPAESWTTEVIATSEIAVISEMSGGTYKRLETKFGTTPEKGLIEDKEEHKLKIPTGKSVYYVTYHSAETVGTLLVVCPEEKEEFTSEGTYTVTLGTLSATGTA